MLTSEQERLKAKAEKMVEHFDSTGEHDTSWHEVLRGLEAGSKPTPAATAPISRLGKDKKKKREPQEERELSNTEENDGA